MRGDLPRFEIDPDIARAETPPVTVYRDPRWLARSAETIFDRCWHHAGDPRFPATTEPCAHPMTLLPGVLDEPLALVRDAVGTVRCLSNVCTHRGNLIVIESGPITSLRCGYHGRRFELDGRFRSMPCFEDVVDFPTERDDLRSLGCRQWGPLTFVSLKSRLDFDAWMAPVAERIDGLYSNLAPDPSVTRSFEVQANWALYVENYLEGFHIPFVHAGLAEAIDLATYETVLSPFGTLQIGDASADDHAFRLPEGHPDHGRSVAAYWFWLFPNLMLNFYPWGLSLNRVEPVTAERTRIIYHEYVADESLRGSGAGGDLDRVEHEDDAIVEQVARGVRSQVYSRGRYSPSQERGVHHFHRLLIDHWF